MELEGFYGVYLSNIQTFKHSKNFKASKALKDGEILRFLRMLMIIFNANVSRESNDS